MRSFFNYAKNRFLYNLLKFIFIMLLGCLSFKSIYEVNALESISKNLFNPKTMIELTNGYRSYTDGIVYSENGYNGFKIPVKPNTDYVISTDASNFSNLAFYNSNFNFIYGSSEKKKYTFTTNNNTFYITLAIKNDYTYFQIEEGLIATPYEPYIDPQNPEINSLVFNSFYIDYIEGVSTDAFSDIAITNIYLGGTKSYSRERCSTNPYFYKDIYMTFTSTFKQGNTYNISFTFESTFMNPPYVDYAQPYLLTGGSLTESHYKDFKATITNYGSSGYTYLYKVDIEFVATSDFNNGRVGFTFNTPELLNSNTSSNIGGDGITSLCPIISSNLRFTALTGYYKTSSDNAIIENANTSKGIWGTLKSVLANIINLPKNIANSLGSFFTDLGNKVVNLGTTIINGLSSFFADLGNKIVNLGTTIINGIKDTLISLFIPENDYFTNWLNDFKITLENKLGFLLYPFELFIDVINRFLSLNDGSGIISIPEVKVPNFDYTIIEAQEYNLKELYETNHIKTIHTIYLYFIDILLVVGLVNLALKKYNSTIGGNA